MIHHENKFKEVIFDKVDVLRSKLQEIIPTTGMADSDAWFALTGEHYNGNRDAFDLFDTIPELKELLKEYNIDTHVADYGVHACKPGGQFLGRVHIDGIMGDRQSPVRLLFPVWGYDDSYTLVYKHLGKYEIEKIQTDFYGGNEGLIYTYEVYEDDDIELVGNIKTEHPYFLNIREPHDVKHYGKNHRVMLWVNFDSSVKVTDVL